MKTLEQFVEELATQPESAGLDDVELLIDNPFLNFQNSEVFFEKKKAILREKIKQSVNALEHYQALENELKIKKTEIMQRIVVECLKALAYPKEIKSTNQSFRIQYLPKPKNPEGIQLFPFGGGSPQNLPDSFPGIPD